MGPGPPEVHHLCLGVVEVARVTEVTDKLKLEDIEGEVQESKAHGPAAPFHGREGSM